MADPDPLEVLGRLLEEIIEVEPEKNNLPPLFQTDVDPHEIWLQGKKRVEEVLAKYELEYRRGGHVVPKHGLPVADVITKALERDDLAAVRTEFDRAMQQLNSDPGAAITAGCALLEALFKAYIEKRGLALPSKETLKPLWSVVQADLGLSPKDQIDSDIQRILTGLSSVVDGIATLRTHGGSAHGGGKARYRMKPRHARLLVSSACTLAIFVIESWHERHGARAG